MMNATTVNFVDIASPTANFADIPSTPRAAILADRRVEIRVLCIMTLADGTKRRILITNEEIDDWMLEKPSGVVQMQFYGYGSKLAQRYPWGSC